MNANELESASFFESQLDNDLSKSVYVDEDENIQYLCKAITINKGSLDQTFIYHDTKCEFLLLRYITEDDAHRNSFVNVNITDSLNRYNNIIPFKHNAVPINPNVSEEELSNYINASFITGPNGIKFISAQNPLENTITSFWLMIIYHKISFVVLFSYTSEESKDKLIPYWPNQEDQPLNIIDVSNGNTFTIKLKSSMNIVEKYVVMREFEVFTEQSDTSCLNIKHYHVDCWEEYTLPLQQIGFQVCDDLITKINEEVTKGYSEPFLIHCSDGVGRSGTFIALFNIIRCMNVQKNEKVEKPLFNVFNVVRKLREERYGMISNAQMYKYIYDFCKKWIEMFYDV